MSLATRFRLITLVLPLLVAAGAWGMTASAATDETPPWPGDLSAAGLRAAASISEDPSIFAPYMPEAIADAVGEFLRETRGLGLASRTGRFSVALACPPNVRANDPFAVPDRVGETQAEVAVCVYGDTVVVGFNDSRAFNLTGSPGVGTLSGWAYSTNGGASYVDGGPVPVALATDGPSGDPGVDTDEQGNWYYNQIYTRAAGAPGPTAQQNIGVHHGRFNGAGVLVWDPPTQASIGTAATGALDKCLLAADRVTGNVYVAYTRFFGNVQIEIVRSTDQGATWGVPTILDAGVLPTASKQAARPYCGPGGEVYVVWEKGANLINCPDGGGNVVNTTGQIGFSRSLDFGLTYSPTVSIGTVQHAWTWAGPGDIRERGNDFPDITVDRSGGPYDGRIYVTWHESADWTTNIAAGPAVAEAADVANSSPGGAELFLVGDNVNGSLSSTTDLDYWQFSATQGQSYFFNLDPQGFNCGVSGTTRGMRLRLFATQAAYVPATGFPDSLLAASALGAFAQRIVWTAPRTGNFLVRVSPSSGTYPATYVLRVRPLTFAAANPARDARDVILIQSMDQGTSWSAKQILNDDPAGLENRRPFVAADGLGHVHAFWHDSRDPGLGNNAALTSIYGTTSRDGGATWTPNYCVTDELSFFSLNTIAVPNLGDYNQAAGDAAFVIAAWSDQRLSTGDVRNPAPPPTYTAGLGPEAYTARVAFDFALTCPVESGPITGGSSVVRSFCIQNTGTIPDSYDYTISDPNGWVVGGPLAGTLGPIDPGDTQCVDVVVNLPLDCSPAADDTVVFAATPVGDPNGTQSCYTAIACEAPVPALISTFAAQSAPGGVDLSWSSYAPDLIRGWHVDRSASMSDGYVRLTDAMIAMGSGGSFVYHDEPDVSGTLYYRLTAVMADGGERVVETLAFDVSAGPATFSFALAGPNPFRSGTSFAYTLPERAPVRVEVFSLSGQRLATLVDRVDEAGVYRVPFHTDEVRGGLGAGVYQVRITAGAYSRTIQAIALD